MIQRTLLLMLQCCLFLISLYFSAHPQCQAPAFLLLLSALPFEILVTALLEKVVSLPWYLPPRLGSGASQNSAAYLKSVILINIVQVFILWGKPHPFLSLPPP